MVFGILAALLGLIELNFHVFKTRELLLNAHEGVPQHIGLTLQLTVPSLVVLFLIDDRSVEGAADEHGLVGML